MPHVRIVSGSLLLIFRFMSVSVGVSWREVVVVVVKALTCVRTASLGDNLSFKKRIHDNEMSDELKQHFDS